MIGLVLMAASLVVLAFGFAFSDALIVAGFLTFLTGLFVDVVEAHVRATRASADLRKDGR